MGRNKGKRGLDDHGSTPYQRSVRSLNHLQSARRRECYDSECSCIWGVNLLLVRAEWGCMIMVDRGGRVLAIVWASYKVRSRKSSR